MKKLIYQVVHIFTLISLSIQQNEEFHEELIVKPLPSGHISTYFQFTTRWNMSAGDNLFHTHLISRSIAEIIQEYNVKEFHVALTQGIWRHELWGYPVIDAAQGAEIWAWFSAKNLTAQYVDTQWKSLCSTLSGVLCASLNFVDGTNSVEPKFSFRPKYGFSSRTEKDPKFIRYSTLPREIVCTENLTPWKKLLPCSSKSGFTSLLNSGYIYNTNYHSLGISVRTFCETDQQIVKGDCVIEVIQTANLVYDPKLISSSNNSPGDFSLRRMFGQGLMGSCPLAKTSKIYADITENNFKLTPESSKVFTSKRGGITSKFAEYDIKQDVGVGKLFNIVWNQQDKKLQIYPAPPIYGHRYIFRNGQENGKIITEIRNNYWTPINVVVQENIPWFVPCYLHTLIIKMNNGTVIQPKFVHFIPGKQREKPYHLEIGTTIPPLSTIKISIQFDYTFLKWLEYPPDANHGHYLGSAVISTVLPSCRNYTSIPIDGYLYAHGFNATRSGYFLQIRVEALILTLPTPDFSMPYNVICLACTVVALAFGPIHSVATKKIVIERKKSSSNSILMKLKQKIFGKKQSEEEEDKNEEEDAEETKLNNEQNTKDE